MFRPNIFVRSAHTRAKKANVQLLVDRYGRRLKGEVFPVAEGHMRLWMHPKGLAAYVKPNEPTPIPVLSATEAQNIRRELQAQAKANAAAAEHERRQQEQAQASIKSRENSNEARVQSLLDSLHFPSAESAPTKAEPVHEPAKTEQPAKQFDWQNDMVVKITNKS